MLIRVRTREALEEAEADDDLGRFYQSLRSQASEDAANRRLRDLLTVCKTMELSLAQLTDLDVDGIRDMFDGFIPQASTPTGYAGEHVKAVRLWRDYKGRTLPLLLFQYDESSVPVETTKLQEVQIPKPEKTLQHSPHYRLFSPPIAEPYRDVPKAQLRAYAKWFMENRLARIAELEAEVRRSPGFESWQADFSPTSLVKLGEWFKGQVDVVRKSDHQLDRDQLENAAAWAGIGERKQLFSDTLTLNQKLQIASTWASVPAWDLTDHTKSFGADIGIYLGETIIRNNPGMKWEQYLTGRNSGDYGHVVVKGPMGGQMGALDAGRTLAYGIADGRMGASRLRELYGYWTESLSMEWAGWRSRRKR